MVSVAPGNRHYSELSSSCFGGIFGTLCNMADQDQYAEMLAQMQHAADAQEEQRRRYRARLRGMYGPGDWPRGTILIFYPNPDEKDQEVRAAVKIGVDQWTITGRGNSRTWDETLEKVGPGKILHRVTSTEPEILVEEQQPALDGEGPA
jgi:hypothetical protein